jgi:ABC-type bacteriocin/lantibiotic exporter with double-glycine peptidase domain
MSCGAACVRQLLLDADIDVPEATIRESAHFDPVSDAQVGIRLHGLADALQAHHPGASYRHGAVPESELDRLADAVPFIVLLRTPSKHFVIVDEVGPTEIRVRDPAGTDEDPSVGATGVIDRTDFIERWKRAFSGTLFRVE